MSSPTLVHATPPSEPRLVVFGHDGTSKPHASWFDIGLADLATKVANHRKMRIMGALATENSIAVALPPGLSPPPQSPSPALTKS